MNFQNVEFLISAAAPKDFPKNRLPEIAFAGKSNVGKSSVINRLLQRKNFARVGDKPGKTVHVNYFVIDRKCYLVDFSDKGHKKYSTSFLSFHVPFLFIIKTHSIFEEPISHYLFQFSSVISYDTEMSNFLKTHK